MPNTKSAERRVRSNERKRLHNRSINSKVKSAEKKYVALLNTNKHEDAAKMLGDVASAYDKAVKSGVIKRGTADRKKSRLTLRLNRAAAAK
ncbi:MAG: 30S ribosomal protein S20 [Verrucomicrobia bacterium]|nr:30S ribosomal protein S20 [Verrucomicrobiota bacterium]